ncbi:MAG: energy transducer TonB [Alphaproteobacteria bacterium]|nr:energy transducer TonB [Alphaproteobacteria bacterium]
MSKALQWPEGTRKAARPALSLVSRKGIRTAFDAGVRDTDMQTPEPPRMARFVAAAVLLHVGLAATLMLFHADPVPPEPPEVSFDVAFEGGGASDGSKGGRETPESTTAQNTSGAAQSDAAPPPNDPVELETPAATDAAPDMPLTVPRPTPRPVFHPNAKPPMPERPFEADVARTEQSPSPMEPVVSDPLPHSAPDPASAITIPATTDAGPEIADATMTKLNESGAGPERTINGHDNTGGNSGEAAGAGKNAEPGWTLGSANNPPPRYPYSARVKGWEGRVVLLVLVDPTGHVVSVEIAESAGRRTLDNAARDAVLNWIFKPGRKAGVPVKMTVRVPIQFQLSAAN